MNDYTRVAFHLSPYNEMQADILVAGNYVFSAPDPAAAIHGLKQLQAWGDYLNYVGLPE